ncbi:antibiotic biosynthesis monooxygenase [Bradyrhizobium diazoefficiens]|nr:antibiotic biosynthesis monooxygenase [Bradyrhizobium diazoefficiens]
MNTKQLLILGASMLASTLGGSAIAQEAQGRYIQLAEIEIDPAQLEAYQTAVREHIETAVRVEPGVLVLYAVSDKDNPTMVKVFEIYRDVEAYKSHLESPHFKTYKATTEKMVKSLKLVRTDAIALGARTR